MRPRYCVDCRRRLDRHGSCDECKARKRHLDALHDFFRRHTPEADDEGRGLRVDFYAAVVQAGGRLFEERP